MEWVFDLRSAIVFGAVVTLLVGGLLLVSWRSLPRGVRPSLRWWLASLGLHTLGAGLLATRGVAPLWLSLALANAVLGLALACMAIALRAFYGMPQRRPAHLSLALLIAIAALWYIEAHPDVHRRTISMALLLALPMASAARAVFRPDGPRGEVARFTGIAFATGAAVMLARAVTEWLWPSQPVVLFNPTPMNIACVIALLALPALATVGFLLMCTEHAQAALERSARLDYLTGIFNRRAIEELASAAISWSRRHGNPLSILLLDVDHFKQVNDDHGHEAGDQALVEAVRRMRAVLRAEDLIGRQGGEEFVVVMPDVTLANAEAAAERLRLGFAQEAMRVGAGGGGPNIETFVTVSIGVASLRPGDALWSHLLRRADRAMYAAKGAGRNTVIVDGGVA